MFVNRFHQCISCFACSKAIQWATVIYTKTIHYSTQIYIKFVEENRTYEICEPTTCMA